MKVLNSSDPKIFEIQNKCLFSGFYYKHLEPWLKEFTLKQLLIIDADKFMLNTHEYLFRIQNFFQLKKVIDYSQSLVRNKKTSMLCLTKGSVEKCFDHIEYNTNDNIDQNSYSFLKQFYFASNKILASLLNDHGYEVPLWLN